MIFDAFYYRERARRATEEARDVRAAYEQMVKAHRLGLAREEALQKLVHETRTALREALDIGEAQGDMCRQLKERVADLEQHVECMAIDLVEAEKTIAAYTHGVTWFEKAGGTA